MEEFKMSLKDFIKKDAANSYELVVSVDGTIFFHDVLDFLYYRIGRYGNCL